MKISNLDSFPYPVLRDNTDDYKSGEFSVAIDTAENMNTGALTIRYGMEITEPTISVLLSDGAAVRTLCITCMETYYNRVHQLTVANGEMEIEKGELSGTVNILPLIILQQNVEQLHCENLHAEFGTEPLSLTAGSILAIGSVYRINVGREKLAPIESIFSISVDNTVDYGQFKVFLESEKITILAEQETYHYIDTLRNVGFGRDILLNCVYQPALMEALFNVSLDKSAYAEKRWFQIFDAKCTHLGINVDNPNLLADTQKMFKQPFKRIFNLRSSLE